MTYLISKWVVTLGWAWLFFLSSPLNPMASSPIQCSSENI